MVTHFVGDGILVSTLSLYLSTQYGGAVSFGDILVPAATAGGAMVITITPALVKDENPNHESGAIIGLLANSADLGMVWHRWRLMRW